MKYLITGGGTGGHIYPAIAIAKYLENENCIYVGSKRGLERKIMQNVPTSFQKKYFIPIQGIYRGYNPFKLIFLNIIFLAKLIISFFKVVKIIRREKIDIIIGTGGYVIGPVILAGKFTKTKIIIHEQNSVPGKANLWASKMANGIAISFENSRKYFDPAKTIYTSNPRVNELQSYQPKNTLKTYNFSDDKKTILFVGGSQGAQKINEIAIKSIPSLIEANYQIFFITGEKYWNTARHQVPIHPNIYFSPYEKNLGEMIYHSDIVISRAGATTIFEVLAMHKPLILIPSPNVLNDHQTKNAEEFTKLGAVVTISEANLTEEKLLKQIQRIERERKLIAQKITELNIFEFNQNFRKLITKVANE